MKIHPMELGKAGEHRVVSELLIRGHRPMLSIVDDGLDIILENGKTLQIKTSASKDYQGEKYSYGFGFKTVEIRKSIARHVHKMIADFAICWCVPDDLFYILPKEVVGKRARVAVIPQTYLKGRPSRYEQYKDAWHLLK